MPGTLASTDPEDGPTLECWSVIARLAAALPRLRLSTLVSSATSRHPAVLANIAAAVDDISDGRLLLGIGASTSSAPNNRKPVQQLLPILLGGGGEKVDGDRAELPAAPMEQRHQGRQAGHPGRRVARRAYGRATGRIARRLFG